VGGVIVGALGAKKEEEGAAEGGSNRFGGHLHHSNPRIVTETRTTVKPSATTRQL
jgi:hypothetical protein